MPSLLFQNFSVGEITQGDRADTPLESATLAQNGDFSNFGRWQKQRGNKLAVAGPAGVTIKSFIQYEWNLPSPFGRQKTWILYAQDGGGRDELWWYPYWDPVTQAWVNGWQELTEFEGPYTTDAGTTTTMIRDAELIQGVDGYYATWVVVNITRQQSMLVDSFTGATRDLMLKHAITGQASGDKYLIYRFALFMPVEGLNAAESGTSETKLVDTKLLGDVADYYKDWKLNNTTRGKEVTVTGFTKNDSTLSHPTITGQTSGDSYYIYTEKHNIRANGFARFYPRENAIEIALGNDEGYPLKAPLWFGFIRKTSYFPNNIVSNSFEGFWLCRNMLVEPHNSVMTIGDAGAGTLSEATWYFRSSFVYDGYQESPLSTAVSLNPAGTNMITVEIDIPYAYNNGSRRSSLFDAIFNKRITHIRTYAAKGTSDDERLEYFLVMERAITDAYIGDQLANFWLWQSGDYYAHSIISNFSDDIWNGVDYLTSEGFIQGKFNRWDINQGHKSTSVDANFKYKALLDEQHYKAPVFTDIQRDGFIGYSVQANGSGVPVDDVIPHENFINLAQKGVTEITGVAAIGGFLIVLTPNIMFRYASGRQLLEFPMERGCIAPNSVVEVDDRLYFVAGDDFYVFDNTRVRKLMFGKILDQWQALSMSDKANAIVGYHKKTDSVWLVAGGTIFIYDRLFDSWRKHVTGIAPIWFATGKDGELFAATLGNIYELESATFTEIITFKWKSKVIDFVKEISGSLIPISANIKRVIVKHKGDNRLMLKLFDPSESGTYPKTTLRFFPQVVNRETVRDVSFEAKQLQLELTDIDQGVAQPSHQVDYIKIEFDELTN